MLGRLFQALLVWLPRRTTRRAPLTGLAVARGSLPWVTSVIPKPQLMSVPDLVRPDLHMQKTLQRPFRRFRWEMPVKQVFSLLETCRPCVTSPLPSPRPLSRTFPPQLHVFEAGDFGEASTLSQGKSTCAQRASPARVPGQSRREQGAPTGAHGGHSPTTMDSS